MISYNTDNVAMPKIPRRATSAWIKSVAASYGKTVGEIAYIFCDDEKILEVNRQYLNHDYYTDIITFDYTEGDTISGDIFISLDTVRSNSMEQQTDYNEELRREEMEIDREKLRAEIEKLDKEIRFKDKELGVKKDIEMKKIQAQKDIARAKTTTSKTK